MALLNPNASSFWLLYEEKEFCLPNSFRSIWSNMTDTGFDEGSHGGFSCHLMVGEREREKETEQKNRKTETEKERQRDRDTQRDRDPKTRQREEIGDLNQPSLENKLRVP